MFEMREYRCPNCGSHIDEKLSDGVEVTCHGCRRVFEVLMAEGAESVGFVPVDAGANVEPLNLPQGSVRALTTFVLAGACWFLMIAGRDVPGYLLSLLLTVIAYYFGFRKKVASAGSRIYDAAAKTSAPLFMPGGAIRFVLIGGFAVSGIVLFASGKMGEMKYAEFYMILAGLVAGYVFGRILAPLGGTAVGNAINHLKGIAVLVAAFGLAVVVTSQDGGGGYTGLGLGCVVSFYFGSRS